MLIRCPACEYTRTVGEDKIPSRAEFATCPKCGHRFRFRALALDDTPAPSPAADTQYKDIWDAVDSLQERWQVKTDSSDHARGKQEEPDRRSEDDESGTTSSSTLENREKEHSRFEPKGRDAGGSPEPVAIPWEQSQKPGYIVSLYHTMLLALLNPARFYSSLTPSLPLTPALFFYILFGAFQYVFDTIWLHVVIRLAGPETLDTLSPTIVQATDVSRIPMTLLILPFILALYLLLTVWLVHLCMRLVTPANANFAITFKIASYAASALVLTAVPLLGPVLGPGAYFIYLLMGCRYAYNITWGKALFGLLPLLAIVLLLAAAQYMPAL